MRRQSYCEGDTVEEAIRAAQIFGSSQCFEIKGFDLIQQIKLGDALLIGEGNLSFAKSLVQHHGVSTKKLVATTYETFSALKGVSLKNALWLQGRGVKTLHGVNATSLDHDFSRASFRTIVFQFPHTGKRKPINGRNPNHVLVKQFLKSARRRLRQDGKVCISYVDSPHYDGAFQFDIAANLAGYLPPDSFLFDKIKFRGYTHVMTNEPRSALTFHKRFRTVVFSCKK